MNNFNRYILSMVRSIFAVMIVVGLLSLHTTIAKADIDLRARIIDCRSGDPIAGASVQVTSAATDLGSAFQAVTNAEGVANINPLRVGNVVHDIQISAPGYKPKTLSEYMAAWTTKEVETCLDASRIQLELQFDFGSTKIARNSS